MTPSPPPEAVPWVQGRIACIPVLWVLRFKVRITDSSTDAVEGGCQAGVLVVCVVARSFCCLYGILCTSDAWL